jgi:hypothetical protein
MMVTAVAQRARQLQSDPDKLGGRKHVSLRLIISTMTDDSE